MVMTLSEIWAMSDKIVKALEKDDKILARHEAVKLADFLQNAHIAPILTTERQ